MYINDSIKKYIDDLASRQPVPGGGSAAALCGAVGTALLEMMCNFTVGNKKYADAEQNIKGYLSSLAYIQQGFESLIDEDVKTYSAIRDAFKSKEKIIIDNALKQGYNICLKICVLSKDGLNIASELPEKGNVNLITDAGCGAELLNASFNSGVFNCDINLKGIEDIDFTEKQRPVLDALKREAEGLYKVVIAKTKERMK